MCVCMSVYSIANRFFERPPIHKHKSISRDATQRSAQSTPMPLYKSYISSATACHNRCHCIPNMYESYRTYYRAKNSKPEPEPEPRTPRRSKRIECIGMEWNGVPLLRVSQMRLSRARLDAWTGIDIAADTAWNVRGTDG